MKTAILLMAYGGPDSLDDIEPYLLDVRGGRPTAPALVEEIRERYAEIGGRSPLLEITRAQAAGLQARLDKTNPGQFQVFVGMRHWKPYIAETVRQIAEDGYEVLIAICMAPHASRFSTGAYRKKLDVAINTLQHPPRVRFIESWHDEPGYIQTIVENVQAALRKFPVDAR
jgi:protoporphyrin/coproporphyrin ferrochelatase